MVCKVTVALPEEFPVTTWLEDREGNIVSTKIEGTLRTRVFGDEMIIEAASELKYDATKYCFNPIAVFEGADGLRMTFDLYAMMNFHWDQRLVDGDIVKLQ